MRSPAYSHTQHSPLYWVILAPIVFILAAIPAVAAEPAILIVLVVGALILFLAAAAFTNLTVTDGGDALLVQFGPLPLARKRIPYDDISDVRRARTRWIDGWGAHYIPWRGWTYNVWGFDCVEFQAAGRTIRIGTDDAEELTRFLAERVKSGP